MKISDMLRESATVDVMGATVVYNAQLVTVAELEALQGITDEDPKAFSQSIGLLARILVSWDLEDERGPVGTDAESLRSLPIGIVNTVLNSIFEDSRPPRAEGEDSPPVLSLPSEQASSDSSNELSSSSHPNGMESSPQRDTSASLLGNLPASQSAG